MGTGFKIALALLALLTGSGGQVAARQSAGPDLDGARQAVTRLCALSRENQLQSPEARALLSGEFARLPRLQGATTLGPLAPPDKLMPAEGGAVARLPAIGASGRDSYFYLKHGEHGWAVDAGRQLAIPPFVGQLRDSLRAKPDRTAEEVATLRNLDLVFASDKQLRQWFEAHRHLIEGLRTDDADAETKAKRLDATSFDTSPEGHPQLVIGGMLDNIVGFLFVAPGKTPPPISRGGYIWVEPVGGGWYLFRTS